MEDDVVANQLVWLVVNPPIDIDMVMIHRSKTVTLSTACWMG